MASRFKESLGFIRSMIDDHVYHTDNEAEFYERFVEEPSFSEIAGDGAEALYSTTNIYHDLYYAFVFIYETEGILDEIICDGLSLNKARSLLYYTDAFLRVVSTNVMIDVEHNDFSYLKKYHLAEDIYVMAKQMYDGILSFHSVTDHTVSSDKPIIVTKYDETLYRLNCKFIRNGLSVIKLFLILVLFQISPAYSEGIHEIARKLTEILAQSKILCDG